MDFEVVSERVELKEEADLNRVWGGGGRRELRGAFPADVRGRRTQLACISDLWGTF